jgi:hypothetical protein
MLKLNNVYLSCDYDLIAYPIISKFECIKNNFT